jgi:hypothetical protein
MEIIAPRMMNDLMAKDKAFPVPGHQKTPETSKNTAMQAQKMAHASHLQEFLIF